MMHRMWKGQSNGSLVLFTTAPKAVETKKLYKIHIIYIVLALENTIYPAIPHFHLSFSQLMHSKYKSSIGFKSSYNIYEKL